MEQNFKEQIKNTRKEVKELQNRWNDLHNAILAQIPCDSELKFTTDLGRLQFHLLEDIMDSFFDVTSGLHKLWATFPEPPTMVILPESVARDSAGEVIPDNVDGSGQSSN